MSLFPVAHAAETATQAGAFNFMQFLPMVVIFVLFWFLLIRPQQKKAKLHSKMVSELQKNDEVITNSGVLGKIVRLGDVYIVLETSSNSSITVQKSAVAGKVEKGTFDKAQG